MLPNTKISCGVCHKNIAKNQKSVSCSLCGYWYHTKCDDISKNDNQNWMLNFGNACTDCIMSGREAILPFCSLTNEILLNVFDLEIPSHVDKLPSFETISSLTSLPSLSDFDIDEHLPQSIDSRYFALSEISHLDSHSSDLSILHTNIRSLALHYDELVSLAAVTNRIFSVIGVSETWNSKDNQIVTNVEIPGYKLYKTLSSSQNGGVGLYVQQSFVSKPREDLDFTSSEFETVWVEVENKHSKNFLFCCTYRHPDSDIDILTSHFQDIFSKLSDKAIFIMGDFNVNLLNYDSHTPTNDFINTMFSNSLLPCIHHPTRISQYSSSVIDNISSNLPTVEITSGNILTSISDHFPQFLILKHANIHQNKSNMYKYDYSTFDEVKFLEDYQQIDNAYLESETDVNNNYNKFLEDVTALTIKHVPIKKRTRKELKLMSKPWINGRIKKMMKIRDHILKKLKKDNSVKNHHLYKKFRNRVASELKKSKVTYFHNYFTINSQNMKNCGLASKL